MQLFANGIGMMQMALIMILFTQDKALPEGMRENKMMAFFSIFLGGQMFSSALTKTSAFEIYMGKDLIYSTLESGRMPNMNDLLAGFEAAGVSITLPRN